MAGLSLNVSIAWENQDEFQQLLKNVEDAHEAFNNALRAFDDYRPKIKVVSTKKEGGNL